MPYYFQQTVFYRTTSPMEMKSIYITMSMQQYEVSIITLNYLPTMLCIIGPYSATIFLKAYNSEIAIIDNRKQPHQLEKTKSYEIADYVKEGKCREVYLSDIALRVVKACISFRNSFTSYIPYLFLNDNSNDGKMHLRAIDNYMRTILHTKVLDYGKEKAVRSPHDCRRTYASLEFLSGTDILTLKEQLGHSDTTQTWDYIKNIVEASERRNKLKGMNILVGAENNSSGNVESDHKNAESLIKWA